MGKTTVIIQDSTGNKLGEFIAEDQKSFTQMAKQNNIHIPTSCKIGSCGMCKANIIEGKEMVQIDKISKPLGETIPDKNGNYNIIFTCIAGVKKQYLDDNKEHIIILQTNF